MQGNSLGLDGDQQGSPCLSSANLIDPRHMVREMLAHPEFIAHTNQEREATKRTCSEVFKLEMKDFIEKARMWAIFPMTLLVGTLIYIFNISIGAVNEANYSIRKLNNSVIELTVAVESMKNHAARLQQENDRNRDGIDKLREQLYRK